MSDRIEAIRARHAARGEYWPRQVADDVAVLLAEVAHLTEERNDARQLRRLPKHIGNRANAEDCPACAGLNLPYPWICPGESKEPPC